ncbi:hypothetical protein ACJJTC_019629 [Scirpophaga incertulas]
MVKTRRMNKSTVDLTTAEVERTQSGLPQRSPSSAIPIGMGQSHSAKRPSDRTSQHTGNVETLSQNYNSLCSRQSSERSRSSRVSTAVCAQKLAVRAEVLRRQVDRERKLAQLEYQAEQAEMQAKLAALETTDKPNKSRSYFSDRSCNRRITSWILDQNANMTETAHGTIPGGALTVTSSIRDTHLQPDAPTTSVPVLCASPVKHAVQSQPTKSLPTAAQTTNSCSITNRTHYTACKRHNCTV